MLQVFRWWPGGGCSILFSGWWWTVGFLVAGATDHWLLAVGCWILGAGDWPLQVAFWLSALVAGSQRMVCMCVLRGDGYPVGREGRLALPGTYARVSGRTSKSGWQVKSGR